VPSSDKKGDEPSEEDIGEFMKLMQERYKTED